MEFCFGKLKRSVSKGRQLKAKSNQTQSQLLFSVHVTDNFKMEPLNVVNLTNQNTSSVLTVLHLKIKTTKNFPERTLTTALFTDIGNINFCVNQSKLRPERSKRRLKAFVIPDKVEALFFDGRKDQTLVNRQSRNIKIFEEHITLIAEPDSVYIDHTAPKRCHALSIMSSINDYFRENVIPLETLKALGCDGSFGGVIV